MAIVKGACPHDCPDACAWEVTVEDGVAVRLAGSRAHPVTRGALCAKVDSYLDRVYSPERVLTPLRRVGRGYPLVLISAKSALHFLNSSYAHLPRHARAEGEPYLELHEADAAARGIADGDLVRARNQRGVVVARARVGDRVRPGVVAMPHGWWPSRSAHGASANVLTSDGLADLGGGADFYSTRIEVEPA